MARIGPIDDLLRNRGPYTPKEVPDDFTLDDYKLGLDGKVLVVGAGGLGCEIIKNLAMCGFKSIDVIDMDTIDISNLNRQFLFRDEDIGKSKAEVACVAVAKVVNAKIGPINRLAEVENEEDGAVLTPHFCTIQGMPIEWYQLFDLVICGLDSVEARRWMNATLHAFLPERIIPMIDGGTEGFRGQARVIIPGQSLCYECTLFTVAPKVTYPVCTIANTPRLPEHCIEWASQLAWPRHFPDRSFDGDDPDDVDWMFETAKKRAELFGISGVTRQLTLGVVKNIIPAIALTNAIIAALCCNEAFKLMTNSNPLLDNYMMYSGDQGIYTYTFATSKTKDCAVCGNQAKQLKVPRGWTLEEFLEHLTTVQNIQVMRPSVATKSKQLYLQSPPLLEEATRPNLMKTLSSLIDEHEEMILTDPALPITMKLIVKFTG